MSKQTSKVVVAKGPGWALAWPRDEWERLTAAEQQAVIDRQTALLSEGDKAHGRGVGGIGSVTNVTPSK